MNAPERHELFVLPEGESKVSMQLNSKILNAATFTIRLEDHTLGNLIRSELLKDPDVLFAGYRVPHPLVHNVELKLQVTNKTTPVDAMKKVIRKAIGDVVDLEDQLKKEMNKQRSY
ncbi:RBP11-like subunits of RNA polymerase [Rozella allomycis CSF55]|uniref:DNA-directed RNA polymerase Rpb11, 13-16kDa subunit domain-containing protein n=1 Tax=Rozella allomycis (strain CSF55) TaxID=988480 RepID=A0A075AUU6_ROZAC|nr:DNA-directed RNA polymerase Rpb11, 13-16kDa subunit domain-containing protein [Rozella allomycis CSF55]RKP18180.1 RBP11-like subunits of RNA polymerase [Rozella allomycis CSF55]|eukprot:EPZ33935.1 DNA-directed RNA polymerase Rpb11, 13-16kDa subunit domain-containing protein [Rozella allomycis CSF55]